MSFSLWQGATFEAPPGPAVPDTVPPVCEGLVKSLHHAQHIAAHADAGDEHCIGQGVDGSASSDAPVLRAPSIGAEDHEGRAGQGPSHRYKAERSPVHQARHRGLLPWLLSLLDAC